MRVRLMTIVDYRGFRLSAQALLPLKELFYGSGDAGETIKAGEGDPHLLAQVRKVGSDLNLAEHKVMENGTKAIKERSRSSAIFCKLSRGPRKVRSLHKAAP